MTLVRSTAGTDTGQRRRRNEDAYVCEPPLFAVADGMGGAQAGEVASSLAAASLQHAEWSGSNDEEQVVALIQAANRRVYERARVDEAASGMGTTMTVALVASDAVRIGHVGDSRAYLVRDGSLQQLTEDHSLVAELVRSGRLSPEEAEAHPQRSVITRVLGTDPEVEVDSVSIPTRPGDLFMLCSDGLTSMVEDSTLLELLEEHRSDLASAAEALITEANRRGGEDNVTVVLFEIPSLDDTIELPQAALTSAQPAEVDEDTLTGLAVLTPIAAAEPARRPAAPTRRRIPLRVVLPAALVVLALVAGFAVFALSRANFAGADRAGHVVVYQGVPWDLPFGIHLYREVYVSTLLAVQLSQTERRKLFDHSLHGRSSVVNRVKRLERDVIQ
jgi:PPM family protein phosphatase